VVAHNAINQGLLCTALGLPPSYFRCLSQNNAAFTVLDLQPNGSHPPRATLERMNRTPPRLASTAVLPVQRNISAKFGIFGRRTHAAAARRAAQSLHTPPWFSTHGHQSAAQGSSTSHALTFGLLGSWFGPEVALHWLFPSPLITCLADAARVAGWVQTRPSLRSRAAAACAWCSSAETTVRLRTRVQERARQAAPPRWTSTRIIIARAPRESKSLCLTRAPKQPVRGWWKTSSIP
jgi:hypothetical protein